MTPPSVREGLCFTKGKQTNALSLEMPKDACSSAETASNAPEEDFAMLDSFLAALRESSICKD